MRLRHPPREADALCELIRAATDVVLGGLAGRGIKGARNRLQRPAPFGNAVPHSVNAYAQDEASPAVAALISKVIGALLPRLVAEVRAARAAPPSLTNTDGDPLCMISARIAVRDAASVMARLADHPDFETEAEDMHVPMGGHLAAPEEGWERQWLDEPVPAWGPGRPTYPSNLT
jgi:hypothetical protein